MTDSPWEWADETGVNFLNWAPGEPSIDSSDDTCAEMYARSWPGLWSNKGCQYYKPYICMADKGMGPAVLD